MPARLPPVPSTITLPSGASLPAGAAVYATATDLFRRVFLTVAPRGYACHPQIAADGGFTVAVTDPAEPQHAVETVFAPGGALPTESFSCSFIPAVRSALARVPGSDVAIRCPELPARERIAQLPTASGRLLAAAVHVPPGHQDPDVLLSGDPAAATLAVFTGDTATAANVSASPADREPQAISCTLPSAQVDICRASLEAFLSDSDVGGHLSPAGLAAALKALDGFVETPFSFEPSEPCNLVSSELNVSGKETAALFAAGDEGSIEFAHTSDRMWDVHVTGRFKVGLGAVLGRGVSTDFRAGGGTGGSAGAGAGYGAGAQMSVSGGLELGLGFGFGASSEKDGRSLVDSLRSSNAPAPAPGLQLTSSTLEVGAWLSGDIGVSPAQGSLDASAVVGVKTDFRASQAVDNEYYLDVNVAADGDLSGLLGAASLPAEFRTGGFFDGELLVGEVVDPSNTPVSGDMELTAGAGAAGGAMTKGLFASSRATPLDFGAKVETGQEATMKIDVDLSNPQNLRDWNALLSDRADTVGGLVGDSTPTPADQRLARAATVTVELDQVSKRSGSVIAKFGDGLGVGFDFGAAARDKQAVGAIVKAPGSLRFQPWDSCVAGGGELA